MKILLLANKLPYPPKDGGSLATLNMATGLAEKGCAVSLLAINTSKHYFSELNIPEEIRDRISIKSVTVNTGINPAKLLWNLLFSGRPYNAERFVSRKILSELDQLLDETQFDIIQLEGPYLDYCIPLIRKRSKALISLRAHNVEHEIWLRIASQAKNPLKRKYLSVLAKRIRTLELELLGQIDLLVPISTRDFKTFRESGTSLPAYTATFGLDPEKYHLQPPPEKLDLFFIGALDWMPNIEGLNWFITDIWPSVKDKFPQIQLYIAGRNTENYYKNKIPDQHIHLLGEVEDAKQFMSEHSIMVVPLRSGSGIRIKILEGMALGKTIITTDIGLEGIEAENQKEIFLANNTEEFIASLSLLNDNPELTRLLGENSRSFIKEKFDNLAICQGLLDFYKEQLR